MSQLITIAVILLSTLLTLPYASYAQMCTKLNPDLTGNRDVTSFLISPDGDRVVYIADQGEDDEVFELYSVPIGGGEALKLSGTLTGGEDVLEGFQISRPNTEGVVRVVYRVNRDTDQNTDTVQDTDNVQELYSVSIEGGVEATRLNTFPEDDDSRDVSEGFQISPNGDRVVYRADQDTDNVQELYSVPIEGGVEATRLNTFPEGDDSRDVLEGFKITPNGERVVYIADQHTDQAFEFFSVPTIGGVEATRLNVFPTNTIVFGFRISPDGERVVYIADPETRFLLELFSVPIEGGVGVTPVKLNDTLPEDGGIFTFFITPNGERVVYAADGASVPIQLFSVPIEGGVAGTLVGGGDIFSFRISPNGDRVVYRARAFGLIELFSVPIGGGEATRLNMFPEGDNNRDVDSFLINPNGDRVVYRADQDDDNVIELYIVPIGGGEATRLNTFPEGDNSRDVSSFLISPNGGRVVYLADQGTDNVFELYSCELACPDLEDPVNGFVLTENPSRVGSFAGYGCDEGFMLVGRPDRECLENAQWGGSAPTCELIECPELESPANGNVLFADTRVGDTAIYMCDENFQRVGPLIRRCQADGTWSDEAPVCRQECMSDNDTCGLASSCVETTDGFLCECDPGFIGDGVTCEQLVKRVLECPELESPANGNVLFADTRVGDTAIYMCDENFQRVGPLIRRCQADGTWSDEAPMCRQLETLTELFSARALGETFRIVRSPQEGACAGFGAEFNVVVRFENRSDEELISDLAIEIATLGGGREIGNADDQSVRGEGARLTVEERGEGYSDGELGPGESVDVDFEICLPDLSSFKMFVDVLGILE